MFNHAIAGALTRPRHLSSDHDPLFEFHRWKANLRILNVTEIKTVPEVPLSHPFIERLVGTIRRELLDQVPFWSAGDLERKLLHFRDYYNRDRVHASLGLTPDAKATAVRRQLSWPLTTIILSGVRGIGSVTSPCRVWPCRPSFLRRLPCVGSSPRSVRRSSSGARDDRRPRPSWRLPGTPGPRRRTAGWR